MYAVDMNSSLPVDSGVKIGKLSNGLTYYLRQNSIPENKAELRLVVNAGSVLEDDDQAGLAHFTEHMAFNGTKNFKKSELTDYLGSIGMGFAGGLNAYTSFDETVYMLKSATDDKVQLKKSIFILSEWADKLSFDHDEIEKERGVIIEEWRGGRGADERIRNKQNEVVLKDSKYAKRSPIGSYEIISTFKPEAIKRFYRDWYRPDLQAVVVVGDIDINEVETYIKEYFDSIPARKAPRERVIEAVPDHKETLVSIVSDKEANSSSVSLVIKSQIEKIKTIGDYKRVLTTNLFSDMFNQRLQELSTKENAPFLYAFTYKYPMTRSKSMLMSTAAVKDNQIIKGFEALATEKERIDRFGFTATELERAKLSLLKDTERRLKEKDKQDSNRLVWAYVRHYLNEGTLLNEDQSYQLVQDLLPLITLEDVNQLIKEYSNEDNRVITASFPEKEGNIAPKEEELLAVLNKTDRMELTPYEDKTVNEPLLANIKPAGKIISKKYNKSADLYELYLSNGVKVVYKKTDFKNNEILFDSFSPGGFSKFSTEDIKQADFINQYMYGSGIGSFDRNALTKYMTGKNAEVSVNINGIYEGLNGSCSPEDFELMMQLIHSYFVQPRKDKTFFNTFISTLEGFLQNKALDPESVFEDSVLVYSHNRHPRINIQTTDSIKNVDLDTVFKLYQDRFADASDFTFFFVGSIDEKQIEKLSENYLANLPALNRKEKIEDHKIEYVKGIHDYKIYSGMEEKSMIKITLPSDYSHNKKNNTQVSAMILVLNEKLRENIREKMSGVYYIYAYPEIQKYPSQKLAIHIFLGCSPDRVEELTQAIYREMDLMRTQVVEEKYMNIYRQTMLQNHTSNIKKNYFWLSSLKTIYQNDRPTDDFINNMNYVNAVKAKEIQKTAQKYLKYDKNRIRFVLYPVNKA